MEKLIVTVVNVFGSWLGDFITPGHVKAPVVPSGNQATGGNSESTNVASSNSSGSSSNANTINVQSISLSNGATPAVTQASVRSRFLCNFNRRNKESQGK